MIHKRSTVLDMHGSSQLGGGGGGPGPIVRKQSGQGFFFSFFLSSTYFTVYRGGSMVLLKRKLYFSKDPDWVQHFLGGSNFFPGGPNANFYRNPYNLLFSRGVKTPYPTPTPPPSGSALVGRVSKNILLENQVYP